MKIKKEQAIKELVTDSIESISSGSDLDRFLCEIFTNGYSFIGYSNMSNDELKEQYITYLANDEQTIEIID